MDTPNIDSRLELIESELASLRQSRRRHRLASVALSAAALASLLIGWTATIPEVIRARKFELVSDRGTVVARLDQSVSGGGALRLMTSQGDISVDVYGDDLMRGLTIYDERDSLVGNMVYMPGHSMTLSAYGIDRKSAYVVKSDAARPAIGARIESGGRVAWQSK